ncbi:hypothetical protein MtrunA17_Chr1g0177641 [Medicago truncatula]|uniref:Transmembrane protein n=2 Tax=Medicago truncatula TaxID=3880 RepID=A0A396JMG9_MEDTR|nr:hypothetical protein MtrunA17_Chr1g0177641 [Medicago truncatula]
MASFIAKSISIMSDTVSSLTSDVKAIFFTLCTMFLCLFIGITNLAFLSLFITPLKLNTPLVHLDSITVTSLNTQAVDLTATLNLTLFFHAPNYDEKIVCYKNVEVIVWWSGKDDIFLGRTILSPFTQAPGSVTMIRAGVTVPPGISNDRDIAIGLGAERDRGSVQIGVILLGYMVTDSASVSMTFKFGPNAVKFPAGSRNGAWSWAIPRPILMHNFMV